MAQPPSPGSSEVGGGTPWWKRVSVVAVIAVAAGWPTSVAWVAVLAEGALAAPLAASGGMFLLSVVLLVAAARESISSEMMLRDTAENLRAAHSLIDAATRKEASLHAKLEQLGASHDTMYALLFKSRRVSNLQIQDEEYVVRDFLLAAPETRPITSAVEGDPAKVFPEALKDRHYDRAAAMRAAKQMRHKAYGLRQFCVDVRQAFPELSLYVVHRETALEGHTDITSGVSAEAEYRRTMGAIFAVYWLARIGIDGAEGFSYGVDEDWRPRDAPAASADTEHRQRRIAFFEAQDWRLLQQLLIDAGCLVPDPSAEGALGVHPERMHTMLALTAIHDIMKVDALLPKVVPHSPDGQKSLQPSSFADYSFEGFRPGDVINDHDTALAYVLEYYPHVLPSFAALQEHEQRTIKFTQGKMAFNHGWLVQGEAPPGPLFSRFKSLIQQGGASKADVAFYFTHWLTDLAGAVPTPLEGSEKFVLQFPQAVLASFIKSFGVIHELALRKETEVYESYLESSWAAAGAQAKAIGEPSEASNTLNMRAPMTQLQTLPIGESAIALMRLVAQAQVLGSQLRLVAAFNELSSDDKRVLSDEMARTGIPGQSFVRYEQAFGARPEGRHSNKLNVSNSGPAILVYYSPAFVRMLAGADKPLSALRLLAEVYRRARVLWPLQPYDLTDETMNNVTVRIDQIKGLQLEQIHAEYASGNSWLVYKRNEQEAIVECHTIDFMADLLQQGTRCAVLKFYAKRKHKKLSCSGNSSNAGSQSAGSNAGSNNDSSPGDSHTPHSEGSSDPDDGVVGNKVVSWGVAPAEEQRARVQAPSPVRGSTRNNSITRSVSHDSPHAEGHHRENQRDQSWHERLGKTVGSLFTGPRQPPALDA